MIVESGVELAPILKLRTTTGESSMPLRFRPSIVLVLLATLLFTQLPLVTLAEDTTTQSSSVEQLPTGLAAPAPASIAAVPLPPADHIEPGAHLPAWFSSTDLSAVLRI